MITLTGSLILWVAIVFLKKKKKQKFGTSGFKGAELFLFAAKCIVQNLS